MTILPACSRWVALAGLALAAAACGASPIDPGELGGDRLPGNGDLAGGDLAGGDLAGGDLVGGDLAGGDLAGGDLAGGDLAGGDLTGGDLVGGDEAGGDLTGGDTACATLASPPDLTLAGDYCGPLPTACSAAWAAQGGLSYEVQFYNGSTWVAADSQVGDSAVVNAVGAGSGYRFRIRAADPGCPFGAWGESASFALRSPPATPTLATPPNPCGNNLTLTIDFAAEAGVTYTVELWDGASWRPALVSGGQARADGVDMGSGYQWRISSALAGCSSGLFNSSGTFSVDDGPTNPVLAPSGLCGAPADSHVGWTEQPGESYVVEFSAGGTSWAAPTSVGAGSATQAALGEGSSYFWRIRAVTAACDSAPFAVYGPFPVGNPASAPTGLAAPDTCASAAPVLSFTAGAGALAHEIDVSGPGGPYTFADAVSPYTATALVAGGTYDWTVTALSPAPCPDAASTSDSFRVAAAPVAASTLASPDVCQGSNPSLSFSGQQQCSQNDLSVSGPGGPWSFSAATSPHNAGALGGPGAYSWTATCRGDPLCGDATSASAGFAIVAQPTACTLLDAPPVCNASGGRPVLSFSGATNALSYNVRVTAGPAAEGPYPRTFSGVTSPYTASALDTAGDYSWAAVSVAAPCTAATSATASARVDPAAVAASSGSSPNYCAGVAPVLSWSGQSSCASQDVVLTSGPGAEGPYPRTFAGAASPYTLVGPATIGTYNWRQRCNGIGVCAAAQSAQRSFQLTAQPSAPTTLATGAPSYCTNVSPVFSFSGQLNATSNDLRIEGTGGPWNYPGISSPYTAGSFSGGAGPYTWTITSTGALGCTDAVSATQAFSRVAAPSAPATLGSADVCLGTAPTLTFSGGADYSQLDLHLTWPDASVTVDSAVSSPLVRAGVNQTGGYSWRVRALGNTPCAAVDSAPASFQVVAPPAAASGLATDRVSYCGNPSAAVIFSWSGGAADLEWRTSGLTGTPTASGQSSPATHSLPQGGYRWQTIRPGSAPCPAALTEGTSFQVWATPTPNPIPIANLTSPPGGPAPYNGTLSWVDTTPRPTGGYEVDLWYGACGGSGTQIGGWPKVAPANSQVTGNLGTAGTYYWRVRALQNGACMTGGTYSACRSFVVN